MAFEFASSKNGVAAREIERKYELHGHTAIEVVKDFVEELRMPMETLYRWRREALIDAGQRPGVESFEADPLRAVRRGVPKCLRAKSRR